MYRMKNEVTLIHQFKIATHNALHVAEILEAFGAAHHGRSQH